MKKILLVSITLIVATMLVACGGNEQADKDGQEMKKVGVLMPTRLSDRWLSDGSNMKEELERLGYEVELMYVENDVEEQKTQIEELISKNVDALVVAPVDGSKLGAPLAKAKENGIAIFAYDRLLTETPNVDYYVTFDNFKVGTMQAAYIEEKLNLLEADDEKYNIELVGGAKTDNNAFVFYDGAMSILEPFIELGTLNVVSGEKTMDEINTPEWNGDLAKERFDRILETYYTDKKVDAVLSPYDGLSRGVIASLKEHGYTTENMPIITGQDAELESVKLLISGEQSQTVFKDTRELARIAASMVNSYLKGEQVVVNNTTTYNNGVKVVDSYLAEPVNVDVKNYEDALIFTDYYTQEEIAQ